jgi:hypothetical protein
VETALQVIQDEALDICARQMPYTVFNATLLQRIHHMVTSQVVVAVFVFEYGDIVLTVSSRMYTGVRSSS